MKSILLIGLGRFGRHIAFKLNDFNHEVMAIDDNEERINAILPYVTNALKNFFLHWGFVILMYVSWPSGIIFRTHWKQLLY